MANYDFKSIEKKWQDRWEKEGTFKAVDDFSLPKFYGLIEFPYPSGAGMHVGHIKAYSGMEVICRKRRMQGYNVLFPIGFDAFGLPAENYAIKTGTHPRIVTDRNIHNFTGQLKRVGFAFDWSRVVDTTDTDYYKWTQWIFLKMFEHGLVFRDKAFVNYCPSCKCVLSNEDSQGGKCDICHSDVVQKSKDVWFLRITEYADKLLDGLKHVDFPANIKAQQENWIGRSTGAFVNFTLSGTDETMSIYTTPTPFSESPLWSWLPSIRSSINIPSASRIWTRSKNTAQNAAKRPSSSALSSSRTRQASSSTVSPRLTPSTARGSRFSSPTMS